MPAWIGSIQLSCCHVGTWSMSTIHGDDDVFLSTSISGESKTAERT